MNNYTYQPLLHDDAIRILTLMPGFNNLRIEGTMSSMRLSSIPASTIQNAGHVWAFNYGPIRGRLENHSNKITTSRFGVSPTTFHSSRISYTTTSYDALSYVWGDPEKVEEIIIDGNRLGVARNLHTGLLRLRHPKERRRLWIDALCINQTDNHERNHQVGFMQRIYTYASSVIVWLGDPKPDVVLTLDMILDYNLYYKLRSVNLFLYDPAALRGLKQLFENSWWRRIWVVQEAVAARELVVVLGRTTFPWRQLSVICAEIHKQSSSDHHLAPALRSCGYQRFRDLAALKAAWKMPLEHLLRTTQHYQATDPRDKIYALLGMALDMLINPLVPDYNKSVQEVFQDLIRLMARRRTLNLICLGNWFGRDQVQLWLPSPQTVALILLPYGGGGARLHRAAGDTQAVVDMSQFPRSLTAQGVVADTVEIVGDSVTIAQECASIVRQWQDPPAQHRKRSYKGFMELIVASEHDRTLETPPVLSMQHANIFGDREAQELANSITQMDMARSFFTTRQGRIGLAPAGVQMGDQVVILKGCHVPLIVRAGESHGTIIGEAYVLGMMYGEVIEGLRNGQYKSRRLRLR